MRLLMYFSTNYNEIAHIKIQCANNRAHKRTNTHCEYCNKGDVGHLLFLSSNFGIFIICPSFNAFLPSIELNTST